jgi:hypothetical protein
VRGIRFFFLPLRLGLFRPEWSKSFNRSFVERFLDRYARTMPTAFGRVGIKVTTEQIAAHFAKIKCKFALGYLRSVAREKAGLDDLDMNGTVDKLTGLTHSEFSIEVGVIEERGMLVAGAMVTDKTALTYELHNACVLQFAGFGVARAEAFVSEMDTRLTPWLGGGSLAALKATRRQLDAAFHMLKSD